MAFEKEKAQRKKHSCPVARQGAKQFLIKI
jgi:hypothetical protein